MAEPAVAPPPGFWVRTRQWRRYWLRDPLLGGLNYALHHVFRALPTEWGSAIGGWFGLLNGRHRFRVERARTLRAYRRLSPSPAGTAEAEIAVDRLYTNIGRVMAELSSLHRMWGEGRIAVEGLDRLLAARAAGRPVIVMGLHLANWEIIGPTLLSLGIYAEGFYQPPRSRFEHRIAVAARRRYGAELNALALPPGLTSARRAYRHLVDQRGVLLVYADELHRGRVSAPGFGRANPPHTNLRNIARYAEASGAAVLPTYCERLAGVRFRLTFAAPVAPGATLAETVERLDRAMEPPILAHLDHWYMLTDFMRGEPD